MTGRTAPAGGDPAAGRTPAGPGPGGAQPYDPLRLCVYATVALLAWLGGAWVVLGFAVLGFTGYLRARRAGLARSRCLLRDTRLVLGYLALIGSAALVALVRGFTG
ncbi:hypothetical protein [Planomonospora parontospora]|uniref:hypothetical protein n=1 Tax=Planomonospora parontospora TaxID=58119 RepID=UPI00199E0C68|nr:hypothetical protein [Planomonospora parontospora]GGL50547.1 hypothetical protein GCM10014719_59830 [Planomonospora parontospora subsp. antibiotica]GII19001.1 hypothetical protein Ppa05_57270 [Planomonospora parontospora subsp. antibiotica]